MEDNMITHEQYQNAMQTIVAYRAQITNEVATATDILEDNSKLLKRGQKIKITSAHKCSTTQVGDVVVVDASYYNMYHEKEPVIRYINKKGKVSHLCAEQRCWRFELVP
jgi:hypothetical protein